MAHQVDHDLSLSLAAANLAKVGQMGLDMAVSCASCYSRMKIANHEITANPQKREIVAAALGRDYDGAVRVRHFVEIVIEDLGIDAFKKALTRSLGGLKVASYYGCLMVRPREVLSFDDPENPVVMDNLMAALGAEPVKFDFKAECCGGYLVVNRRDVAASASKKIVDNARAYGAEAIVTTCPLCQYNLDKPAREAGAGLPVFYFTQLLGLAVGLDASQLGLDYNGPGAEKFLKDKGLI
jgi:heterodisulfide reductase subunit B